ncbi:uncharacterized protein LOC119588940 [Penaeus monodon]|uniref:uncharacterized protein LOC119588940 n=1 Tax=Penaeus monodon TaxID=6687 RepID=UPI0018A7136E|nr:uncharacterized protein LOC119588940 [Penaeus monodon]
MVSKRLNGRTGGSEISERLNSRIRGSEISKRFNGRIGGSEISKRFNGRSGGSEISKRFNCRIGGSEISKRFNCRIGGSEISKRFNCRIGGSEISKRFNGRIGGSEISKRFNGRIGGSEISKRFNGRMEVQKSPRGSTAGLEVQKSPRGSTAGLEVQKSPRGSVPTLEAPTSEAAPEVQLRSKSSAPREGAQQNRRSLIKYINDQEDTLPELCSSPESVELIQASDTEDTLDLIGSTTDNESDSDLETVLNITDLDSPDAVGQELEPFRNKSLTSSRTRINVAHSRRGDGYNTDPEPTVAKGKQSSIYIEESPNIIIALYDHIMTILTLPDLSLDEYTSQSERGTEADKTPARSHLDVLKTEKSFRWKKLRHFRRVHNPAKETKEVCLQSQPHLRKSFPCMLFDRLEPNASRGGKHMLRRRILSLRRINLYQNLI